MIAVLVVINIVGVQESAKLNVVLAVIDFGTQVLLVLLGFVLVFSPHVLVANIHLGVAPTWASFFLAIPVAMLAYTGIETVSNMAEEVRDPVRTVPRAVLFVAIAVFAIYFTLPWVALSALPVFHDAHGYTTCLAAPPTTLCQGVPGYQNDPVLGVVNNLGLGAGITHVLQIYLGILAATILFIGANAGVIGASRITYAMSGYRQLPRVFRRIHPKFKTPWIALVVFAGTIPILLTLTGETAFLGAIYSFGATFSFTIAHASIVRLRMKQKGDEDEIGFKPRGNIRWRGTVWPVFAIVGGLGTGLSWIVIVVQSPTIRYAGLGWLVLGLGFYFVYRRYVLHEPMTETIRAPVEYGKAAALEFRTILVPIAPGYPSDEAMDFACRLAAERRASIVAVTAIQVPLDQPLDAYLPEDVAGGERATRRGACDRRLVRRARHGPHRAYAQHRPRDLRRGRPPRHGGNCDGGTKARPPPARPPPDLRRLRRLRPPARAVPRDGRDGRARARESDLPALDASSSGSIALGLGLALLVETAAQGGGSVGYLLGVLFLALGIGRLYLARRR